MQNRDCEHRYNENLSARTVLFAHTNSQAFTPPFCFHYNKKLSPFPLIGNGDSFKNNYLFFV